MILDVIRSVDPLVRSRFASIGESEAKCNAHLQGGVIEFDVFVISGGEDLSCEVEILQLLIRELDGIITDVPQIRGLGHDSGRVTTRWSNSMSAS